MFPRNPENEAWRLPQPARGAALPQGPTDAELLGVCARVCVYIHMCVCRGVQALCESVCMHACSKSLGAQVCYSSRLSDREGPTPLNQVTSQCPPRITASKA